MANPRRITAVLGPTNTGKTHYAIERMLSYQSGVMGLPLRLLAREVYDKICDIRDHRHVALITGEERIVPPKPKYWICTVEAMPMGLDPEFLAVDEIQLCADPDRGYVFTQRLLHARGRHETLFMGADTMRNAIRELIPEAEFMQRERFSDLVYSGARKISRMIPRSAVVSFSVDNVYGIAELLRRQKGGAAVVMGALSPRTRNAQVELYQNGDVDYLVATDAIGMGLNLDIGHVAFSALSKFDGHKMRMLYPNELAQIAGRAGRHMDHGTYGVTGEAPELSEETIEMLRAHRFPAIKKLFWRNPKLNFASPAQLISSLERMSDDPILMRTGEADDLKALRAISGDVDRYGTLGAKDTELLWSICQIPDFRGVSPAEHAAILTKIFDYKRSIGRIPDDWIARQVKALDQTAGDIDALSRRLAFIRTWTYVAQRKNWLDDETHWRAATRAVEDRLSDALHERLTQRFVDRRTSVLLRRLKQKESLLADVNDKGEVTVEGEFIGRLAGFRFMQDKTSNAEEAKTVRQASITALTPEFHLRADRFYNAPDTEIDYTEQGGLMWGEHAVGKLVKGADVLKPTVEAFVDEEAGPDVMQKVTRRLQHFIDRKIAALFEPLNKLSGDEELTGLAKGFAFQMVEGLGLVNRTDVAEDVKALDQDMRGALRKHGIRFGQFTIFMPLLLKPAPTRLRLVLWSLASDFAEFPESPPAGVVTVPTLKDAAEGYHLKSGYRAAGERAIRIDMLERLADLLRTQDSRGGFEATADMLSITGMTLVQFADLMQGLGYGAEEGTREKLKAAPAESEKPTEEATEAAPSDTPEASAEETPEEAAAPEMETFYTFRWMPKRKPRPNAGGKPQGDRRPPRKGGKGKPQGNKAKSFKAAPPKKEKKIDPDNPFAAALMGLKDKG